MKKKPLMILMAIILTILIVLIVVLNNLLEKRQIEEEKQTDIETRKEAINEYCEDKVLPRGISTLYGKYKGQNSKNDLYRNFNDLVQYLPDLYSDIKEMDVAKLSSYYEEEYSNIEKYLGIEEEEDFERFAKYIQTMELENVTFNSAEIDDTTYENTEEYLSFDLELVYNGIENIVKVRVSFANKTITKPMVVYDVVQ